MAGRSFEITNILDIIDDSIDVVLLDASGVFWRGSALGLYPGAKDVFTELKRRGKKIGILSNGTFLSEKEIQKYAKHGLNIGEHYDFYLTSGQLLHDTVKNGSLPFVAPRKKYFPLFGSHPKFGSPNEKIFAGTGFESVSEAEIAEADFIYVDVPHLKDKDPVDREDPEEFRPMLERLIESGLPMLCANPDHCAPEGKPARMVVRQGKIASMYQELGGEVHYFGKPYQEIFKAAITKAKEFVSGLDLERVVMVGDTPETDIVGANQAGIKTVLVLQEGGNAGKKIAELGEEEFLQSLQGEGRPDHIVKSFA